MPCGLVTKSCPTLGTPQTVDHQASLPMVFPRQEYWSGLPFPSPGDLPDPGIKPTSPAMAGRVFTTEPPWGSCLQGLNIFCYCTVLGIRNLTRSTGCVPSAGSCVLSLARMGHALPLAHGLSLHLQSWEHSIMSSLSVSLFFHHRIAFCF